MWIKSNNNIPFDFNSKQILYARCGSINSFISIAMIKMSSNKNINICCVPMCPLYPPQYNYDHDSMWQGAWTPFINIRSIIFSCLSWRTIRGEKFHWKVPTPEIELFSWIMKCPLIILWLVVVVNRHKISLFVFAWAIFVNESDKWRGQWMAISKMECGQCEGHLNK